jgi:hypothetical protein
MSSQTCEHVCNHCVTLRLYFASYCLPASPVGTILEVCAVLELWICKLFCSRKFVGEPVAHGDAWCRDTDARRGLETVQRASTNSLIIRTPITEFRSPSPLPLQQPPRKFRLAPTTPMVMYIRTLTSCVLLRSSHSLPHSVHARRRIRATPR